MPNPMTMTMTLHDSPLFVEENPDFSFGSLAFQPGDDVLCMLDISFTNGQTYQALYEDVRSLVTFQGARLWTQAFDLTLQGGITESLDRCLIFNPAGDLPRCLTKTVQRLPLPNGRYPKHVVFAFDGRTECNSELTTRAPILNGQRIPTTLVVPLATVDPTVIALWEQCSDVDILDPHVLPRFKAAIEGLEVRELQRLCEVSTRGPMALPEPRKRL